MADKCTLLCLKDDPESMVRLANIILTGIDKTEQDTEHKKLIIYSGSSVIKLTRKLRTRTLKIFMQSKIEARNSLIQLVKWSA